ncbi:hypothetical protein M413DRAFT_27310 [Hebeloma cylindrosporum]|uniref:Uncharacterized protein n=1 Tax=Hebeloma cylindrosporum TaxID=76867 RepID=A0A0C2XVQ3_HEBCY|nr:hypothetical protein M413DRAFT_27310 [Hebeloma cylindrosporum h7]
MAIDEVRKLTGFMEGDRLFFDIEVPIYSNLNVSDLRELTWEKRKRGFIHILENFDIKNLVLFKLNTPVELRPSRTLAERVSQLDAGVLELLDDPSDELVTIFPEHLSSDGRLHFVVRLSPVPEPMLGMLTGLHQQISLLPDDPTYYSNPAHVIQLPFPSINEIPDQITVSPNYSTSYMGRVCFGTIWQGFHAVMENRRVFYIYGSKGCGKTYLILALACLLVRHGHRVVYLPDCRAMLRAPGPFVYLRNALLFTFADPAFSLYRSLVYHCETLQDLARVCGKYCQAFDRLCFVSDRRDALNPERGDSPDEINFKFGFLETIEGLFIGAVHLELASSMVKEESRLLYQNLALLGGLTTEEMSFWWKHHDALFTKFSVADKQRIEDLTGCLPLLLEPFVAHPGEPREALEPQIWDEPPLSTVVDETLDFAQRDLRSNFQNIIFKPTMEACLMPGDLVCHPNVIDYRYFYVDDRHSGHYTCGLAREAIIQFFRLRGENIHVSLITTEFYKNNPSAMGFIVEHLIIRDLSSWGLRSRDFNIPPAEIVAVLGGSTSLSNNRALGYYVPLKFNRKVVDVVFAGIDQGKSTALVIGIKITVSKPHRDAEAAFFAELDKWLPELRSFKVEPSFLWIYEGNQDRAEIETKLMEERGRLGTVMHWPNHKVAWVSVSDAIGGTLEGFRRECSERRAEGAY